VATRQQDLFHLADVIDLCGDVRDLKGHRVISTLSKFHGNISSMAHPGFCQRTIQEYLDPGNLVQYIFILKRLRELLCSTPGPQSMATTGSYPNFKHVKNGNRFVAQNLLLKKNGFEYSKPQVKMINGDY
jgi:hypothetical protein